MGTDYEQDKPDPDITEIDMEHYEIPDADSMGGLDDSEGANTTYSNTSYSDISDPDTSEPDISDSEKSEKCEDHEDTAVSAENTDAGRAAGIGEPDRLVPSAEPPAETDSSVINEKSSDRKKKGRRILLLLVLAAAGAGAAGWLYIRNENSSSQDAVSYRAETASYGDLTVGITESGSLTVGTTEQTFDLDLSAYTGSSQSSSGTSSAMPGGMDMGGGSAAGMGSDSSSSSSGTRALTISEVLISEGEEISEGDPVLTLDSDSVDSIRTDLTEDVNSAELDLDSATTSESSTAGTASVQQQLWSTYGTYAQAEYDSTIQDLQDAVDTAQEAVDDDNDNLEELQEELADAQSDLAQYKKLLENAEYVKSTTDKTEELYAWVSAENTREEAQSLVDDTEDTIDDLNDQIEAMQTTLEQDQRTLNEAQESLASGTVTAKAEYDQKMVYYSNASSYNSTLSAQGTLNKEIAQTAYDDAEDKLDAFNSAVSGDEQILSELSGVIESVNVSAGDSLGTGTAIFTVNSDSLTISVDVSADDIDSISEGDSCKVSVDAFPDTEFTGTVDEIGDSSYNSSTGETTYEVTVSVDDAGEELLSGMSADVTFVTRDTEKVVYVPNRAIIRENGKSYVLQKDDSGNMVRTEVETGFSDGTNVEIRSGLGEGDVVYVESKGSGT